ncbi:MAG: DUF3794 domain-containing protein [Clostridioides sp.]|jgi:hypothetical protein|nr:DUF3794 domain-containing protein [Clostridioides sp.]
MDLIKDVIKVDNRIDFGKYQTYIESETVVPDKKMDVYEIVKTEGYISFRKIEVTEGKLLLRGTLNYNVIYIANDKNTVSNVNGKIDINEVVEKDSITQGMKNLLFPEVEHMDCTIMNERKLKIGALMNVRGSLFREQKLEIVKDINDVSDVQKHEKEVTYQNIVGIEETNSDVRDTININSEEVADIISLNPSVKVKESRVTDNKVIIAGILEICPIAVTYEDDIIELEKIITDFTQFVDIPEASEGMKEEVLLSLTNFDYNFKQNQDASNSVLELNANVNCKAKVSDEYETYVLQDAYSPTTVIKFDQKSVKLNKCLCNNTELFTIRETISNENDDSQIQNIVSVDCNASIENSYIDEAKSVIQGIIKLDILYIPVEGVKKIYKISNEIPFEHDIIIDNLNDTSTVFNTCSLDKVEADLNRDQIDVNIRIRRNTEALNKYVENFIVKGEDLGEYDLSNAPSIIIYVCKEGDTFWNIAKKYNTTEEEIAELNELDTK